ncbi:MAG: PHP domain-containing protein [Clostridia bacterium]|nr:PHP domain-containing protein [Clostridia bacterium]
MYKTEPHLHLKEVSSCGRLYAHEMLPLYKNEGYDTVFVTDHLSESFFEKREGMTKEEKADAFCLGYKNAKEIGDKLGITVIFAAELQMNENKKAHFLLYGIDRDFILWIQDNFHLSIKEVFEYLDSKDVFVVQAHPYRDEKITPIDGCAHAIEAHNTSPRHINYDDITLKYAALHGLPTTAGSDAHRPEDVAGACILSEKKINSPRDYAELIKSGKHEIILKQRVKPS